MQEQLLRWQLALLEPPQGPQELRLPHYQFQCLLELLRQQLAQPVPRSPYQTQDLQHQLRALAPDSQRHQTPPRSRSRAAPQVLRFASQPHRQNLAPDEGAQNKRPLQQPARSAHPR